MCAVQPWKVSVGGGEIAIMTFTEITAVTAAIGAATWGGVLFAFSTFVMPGLDAAPPSAAISTMQEINRAAPRSLLALDMMATLVLCIVVALVAALSIRSGGGVGSVLLLVGAVLYVVSFAITVMYHIPRNNELDGVLATGPHAAQAWHDFARPWELWTHARAFTAVAGAASMLVGLLVRSA
jgi:uncharacterized membrane protein